MGGFSREATGLFGKKVKELVLGKPPKRAQIPPTPDPTPSPVPLDVKVLEKQRAQRRQRLRSAGRQGTILTQGGLGTSEAETRRSTLLGGAA